MPIAVNLDALLQARGMTLTELSQRVDLTLANLSILKTGKAKAIRFSTLEAICRELDCQPGDLIRFEPANADRLTRMGWYALGATVAGWLVGAMGHVLEQEFEGLEVSVSPIGGLVLVITLFVLARVFRHGAAMRDDLNGTV